MPGIAGVVPRPTHASWSIDPTIPAASWSIDPTIPAASWIIDRTIPAPWWIIDRPHPAASWSAIPRSPPRRGSPTVHPAMIRASWMIVAPIR
jgi:hypothetical protein